MNKNNNNNEINTLRQNLIAISAMGFTTQFFCSVIESLNVKRVADPSKVILFKIQLERSSQTLYFLTSLLYIHICKKTKFIVVLLHG